MNEVYGLFYAAAFEGDILLGLWSTKEDAIAEAVRQYNAQCLEQTGWPLTFYPRGDNDIYACTGESHDFLVVRRLDVQGHHPGVYVVYTGGSWLSGYEYSIAGVFSHKTTADACCAELKVMSAGRASEHEYWVECLGVSSQWPPQQT